MTAAAELLGLTHERLRQLALEHPDIPMTGRGRSRRFLWPPLRKWRDAYLRSEGVRSVRPQSVEEARARKLAAEADLAEIELAERRGQLVPAAFFRQEFEGACARLRASLLNAPTRFAPRLLEVLAAWVPAHALRHLEEFLSKMTREVMTELETGEDVPEDEEPPGARTGTGPISA